MTYRGGVFRPLTKKPVMSRNLRNMFRQIVAVGNDLEHRSNICTGSVLIERMTLAGS